MDAKPESHTRLICAVETTLRVIGGRWKVLILRELFGGVKRFGELHRALSGITQKMLFQSRFRDSAGQKSSPLTPC